MTTLAYIDYCMSYVVIDYCKTACEEDDLAICEHLDIRLLLKDL